MGGSTRKIAERKTLGLRKADDTLARKYPIQLRECRCNEAKFINRFPPLDPHFGLSVPPGSSPLLPSHYLSSFCR